MEIVELGNGYTKQLDYYDSGEVKYECFCLNDKKHREDGPALIWYYKSGQIERELYYLNDWLHNLNGPADIWYSLSVTKKIFHQLYAIQGITLTKEDFENRIFSKKLSLI